MALWGFERARLQPCRNVYRMNWALAPEGWTMAAPRHLHYRLFLANPANTASPAYL